MAVSVKLGGALFVGVLMRRALPCWDYIRFGIERHAGDVKNCIHLFYRSVYLHKYIYIHI